MHACHLLTATNNTQ